MLITVTLFLLNLFLPPIEEKENSKKIKEGS